MREVIYNIKDKILASNALVKFNLIPNNYFVWSSHREENITQESNFYEMINSLNSLAREYDKPIFFPAHPRTKKMIQEKNISLHDNIILSEPIGIIEYCKLQMNSCCVISDSGTLTEETDILRFKGIMLRTSTEKPEGIEAGTITVGNLKWDIMKDVLKLVLKSEMKDNDIIPDYSCDSVSDKVCKIIIGYTSIVNKFIWMK